MPRKNGFAQVNETNLYYEIQGRGETIIFIHARSINTSMWDDQFDYFAKKYQVVRYDVRGYGKSSLPADKPYSHQDDLKALLDYLNKSQAHVLGLSMGGGIAIDFTLAYPEHVTSLIACDTALGGFQWSETQMKRSKWLYENLVRAYQEQKLQAAIDVYLQDPLVQPALDKGLQYVLVQQLGAYQGWHLINPDPLQQLDPPAINRLQEIHIPTLLIVGDRDLDYFQEIIKTIHGSVQNARKEVIANSGHVTNMEQPEIFNEVVMGFLESL